MNKIKISKLKARRFLIGHQGIHQEIEPSSQEIQRLIKKIGCIQYDPLDVVGRNSDLVLQARVKNYKDHILDNLMYEERVLIDGWDKMMAIYHRDDFANFKPVRDIHCQETISTMKYRNTLEALDLLDEVKGIVQEKGPIFSRDIASKGRFPSAWGHGKYSSVALDYLFHSGEIGVHHKRNAQKSFDVISKLLPKEVLEAKADYEAQDFLAWYVQRRIRSVGLLWSKNGGGWLGHFLSDKKARTKALEELLVKGQIMAVEIEGIKDDFYIHKDDLKTLETSKVKEATSVIGPLDNLIWDRKMTQVLFDFEYTWEVYVPKAKRKYGYYVLPVLMGNRFVARFEPEKYRGEKYLKILNWWWEEDLVLTDDIKTSVIDGMEKFCLYLGAEDLDENSYFKII